MDNPPADEQNRSPEEGSALPIRLTNLDTTNAEYANLVSVSFDRASFQVVLAQFFQPVLVSPADATLLAEQGYVPARVVGRFVFTPFMVEEVIGLLTRQLDAYRAQRDKRAAENGGDDGQQH